MALVGLIMLVPLGILFIGSVWVVGKVILGPAAERERRVRARTRFMLSDLLWLIVMMQVALAPLAAVSAGVDARFREDVIIVRILFVLVSLAVVAVWWGTMRMFSRAGVRSPLRRGVLLAGVVPLAFALMFAFPIACGYLLSWLAAWLLLESPFAGLQWPEFLALGIVAGAFPLAWLLRRVTVWGIRDAAGEEAVEVEDGEAVVEPAGGSIEL